MSNYKINPFDVRLYSCMVDSNMWGRIACYGRTEGKYCARFLIFYNIDFDILLIKVSHLIVWAVILYTLTLSLSYRCHYQG